MKRLFIFLVVLSFAAYGADLDPEVMVKHLQKNAAVFDEIIIKGAELPADFHVKLGDKSTVIDGEYEFDGFRFKMPKEAVGFDMIWYFNAPQNWANWYILPVTGEAERGFRNWFNADKVYNEFDDVTEKDRFRAHQTLTAEYFKADTEYLIWFRKVSSGNDNDLRGRISFEKSDDEWELKTVEETLFLEPQKAASQVAALESRGGRILLDKEFFSESYAEERIENVFFSMRHTTKMRSGLFITIETAIPPCRTNPSYKDILKRYGPADCVITPEEKRLLNRHSTSGEPEKSDKSDEEDDDPVATYYYDHFGFEVSPDDPEQKVLRVVTHAKDYSVLKPVDDKPSFANVDMMNLTVFLMDKKEVGRMYYFLEGDKIPLVIKEPPVGIYKVGYQDLEYKGKGSWIRRLYYRDGKLARIENYEKHQMNGPSEGHHNNGKKSYMATYKDGYLHGEVVRYSEDGKEIDRIVFKNGSRQ